MIDLSSHHDKLSEYEKRLSSGSRSKIYDIFYDLLDDDLWNILLTKEYVGYESIRNSLPDLPALELQKSWTGRCGMALSIQSCAFYKKVKNAFTQIVGMDFNRARILDFGCGWGRLIRYFAKDVPEQNLCGCDPDDEILKVCSKTRVPGVLKHSDYRPQQLPFEEKFDLSYAYSVFTHLSERTHFECLNALFRALAPGGLLILTVRPRTFIEAKGIELSRFSSDVIKDMVLRFNDGKYIYAPYNMAPVDGEITYGDTAIPYSYIEKQWTEIFELIGPLVFDEDPYQIPIVLRKR